MVFTYLTYLFLVRRAYAVCDRESQGYKATPVSAELSLIQHQVAAVSKRHSSVSPAFNRRAGGGMRDSLQGIPTGKTIGIILRGQTFRAQYVGGSHFDKTSCDGTIESLQMNYTKTLLEQVIKPFEAYGNEVQVVSTAQPCELNHNIEVMLSSRSVEFTTLTPENQSQDLLQALDVFAHHYGGVANVAKMLDYVLVVRHDLQWLQDITHWENDFDAFSFLARCNREASAHVGGENCVHDIVHWMPAKLFPVFYATVGHEWRIEGYKTFTGKRLQLLDCFVADGHGCYYPVEEALSNYSGSANISFLTPVRIAPKHWNPLVNVGRVGLGKKEKSQGARQARMSENAAAKAADIAAKKAARAEQAACPDWCTTLAEQLHAREGCVIEDSLGGKRFRQCTEAEEWAEKCTWATCRGCPTFKANCPPAVPHCATNYGNTSACCGQFYHDDVDASAKHVCPLALPMCVGYVPATTLGVCQDEPPEKSDVAGVAGVVSTMAKRVVWTPKRNRKAGTKKSA